jgi:hypothetical protein
MTTMTIIQPDCYDGSLTVSLALGSEERKDEILFID